MPRHRRRRTTSVFSFTSASSSSSSSSSDIDEDDIDAGIGGAYTSKTRLIKVKSTVVATAKVLIAAGVRASPPKNILLRILHRERSSFLSGRPAIRCNQQQLAAVPHGLSFCLQDIVPFCYLTGHVFMGLTLCGQFLLSYKETVVETTDFNDFCIGSFKYELFFWIYRPHQLLRKYYSRCLFDDRGADNEVRVTMCQWPGRPRTLVVHGSCKYEHENSYVSVVAVPRLGCLDCRRLRDRLPCSPDNAPSRSAALCVGCNLTVHTKYTRAESDPPFEPRINLNCPDRLILFSNGLIHMLNVSLHLNRPSERRRRQSSAATLDVRYVRRKTDADAVVRVDGGGVDGAADANRSAASPSLVLPTNVPDSLTAAAAPSGTKSVDIVAQIIADFDEYDSQTDAPASHDIASAGVAAPSPPKPMTTEYFEQLVLGTLPSATTPTTTATTTTQPNDLVTSLAPRAVAELRRTSSASLRWITRLSAAPAAPTTTASVVAPATSSSSPTTTTSAYDFADEPPERYEKISSYRKRRLADKKYEFSEDNSENIIPFAKLRMRRMQSMLMMMPPSAAAAAADGSSPTTATSTVASNSHSPHHQHHHHHHFLHQPPNGSQSPLSDGGASMQQHQQQTTTTPHSHRASPSHGFRSPCGSPVGGNRFTIMSPPMLSVGGSYRSGGSSSSAAATSVAGGSASGAAGTAAGTTVAGGSAGGGGLFGRSPTYKPFGSSPRYVKRFEQSHNCAGTIYSPLLLSPRSDGDYEVYRLGGGGGGGVTTSAPLAEVKPSNIFTTATSTSSSISVIDSPIKESQNGYAHSNTAVTLAVTAVTSAAQQTTLVLSSTVATELPTTATATEVVDDEATAIVDSLQPICVKKLMRCFVTRKPQMDGEGNDAANDDDDRTSVLTSEEDDDCISPGYHTSLPVAVHGACYANLQQVSAGRLQQQQQRNDDEADECGGSGHDGDSSGEAVVRIVQHTFDLETLTYHVANHLCSLHDKQYGSFYDWACEPIHICPLSDILVSLLMVNFTARDATQPGAAPCLNCANGDRLDCAFHRRHFESRSLFAWNVRNADWHIIDYGDLAELASGIQRSRDHTTASLAAAATLTIVSSSQRPARSPTAAVDNSVDGSVSDESSSTTTAPATALAANAASDGAHDLATRARRAAIELRATLPTQFADDGRRNRNRDSSGGGKMSGVGWTLAGLHTLDSCTDRSKEFLRDQYNAIEFVRDAVADRGGAGGADGSRRNYLHDLNASSSSLSTSSEEDNSDWE